MAGNREFSQRDATDEILPARGRQERELGRCRVVGGGSLPRLRRFGALD
jgi:hypothetical protein